MCRRYALEWNVDFLKNDCVFGAQFVLDEVTVQSQILESLAATHGVDLVYSLSPGGHDTVPEIVAKGREVSSLVSMYRVNNDDWDNWFALGGHFDVAAAFAEARLAGQPGLNGRLSFPDFDMLPLGYITCPGCNRSHYPYVVYTPLSLPRGSTHYLTVLLDGQVPYDQSYARGTADADGALGHCSVAVILWRRLDTDGRVHILTADEYRPPLA